MTVRLTREIRFTLTGRPPTSAAVMNSWGGWPSAALLAPFLQLRCTVEGEPAAIAGYVCNVKLIDNAFRQFGLPEVARLYEVQGENLAPGELLTSVWSEVARQLPDTAPLVSLELLVTPMLKYEILKDSLDMIRVTQQFEFSAAHRLHCQELSDEENREHFGKCNNPSGHGHNYRLDVTVVQPTGNDASRLSVVDLEQVVKQQVIDRFDHKHLNEDTEEFRQLNPTVENIASTVWSLLDGELSPAVLDAVRVYETPKTWAECRGDE